MTDRLSFEALIEPAAGVRPPANEEAQRAANQAGEVAALISVAEDLWRVMRHAPDCGRGCTCHYEPLAERMRALLPFRMEHRALSAQPATSQEACDIPEKGWACSLPLGHEGCCQRFAYSESAATSQPEETWMNDPRSLDAGLPETSQAAEDCTCGNDGLFMKLNGVCTNCGKGQETKFAGEERKSLFLSERAQPATSQERETCICGGRYTMCADGHAVNCPAGNQLSAYERMTAAQTVRDVAVRTEATRLMFEQIHREGGREVAGHRVTGDMAIMASGVLETVCKDLAAALAQVEAK